MRPYAIPRSGVNKKGPPQEINPETTLHLITRRNLPE